MAAERLEGALTTLEPVTVERVGDLVTRFQDPWFHLSAGMRGPPDEARLRRYFAKGWLYLWDVKLVTGGPAVLLVGVGRYSGPPFLFVTSVKREMPPLDVTHDACELAVRWYFAHSDEPALWIYPSKPVAAELHALLIESGFDLYEYDLPGVDPEKETPYVMERHTYEAYYGSGDEDFEENPDGADDDLER